MKYSSLFSAIVLLVAPGLQGQSAGSASLPVQPNNTYSSGNISTMGSFLSVDAISYGTTSVGSTGYVTGATTTNGSISSWSPSGQTKEYYNPYTGKYESAPSGSNDQANASLPYDNSVIFDADVMINVKASSYTAIFSVTDFGTTVLAADSTMSARLKTFLAGLKKDSVDESDIHIDFITMLPVYVVEPENKVFSNIATEKPAGFKIKKNVHVMFYDHRKLDHIITDAAHAGIYDLVKVDYNVNNIEAAYDTLRKVAISVIDMKRNTYMNLGFTTTILTMAEGYDSKYPEERYESYTAYIQGVSAQNLQQQNPNIQVRQADKEQTIFYNKVPYKQFDKVLNADLAEPGVQFYYKLRVKCRMEPIQQNTDTGKPAAPKPVSSAPKPAGTYKPPVQQPARKP